MLQDGVGQPPADQTLQLSAQAPEAPAISMKAMRTPPNSRCPGAGSRRCGGFFPLKCGHLIGGGERIRTADLLLAKQALSR